ncbi:hypothetical protein N7522_004427 [Penicillium canescens]|nr:hypothetical protein N7522_004427 [Penicillium canescens]
MALNTAPTKATSAQKYPCSMCNKKSFKSKEALGDHQIARHAHSCIKCEERFNSAESLAQHMKDKDHNTKKAKALPQSAAPTPRPTPAMFPCTKCNKKFMSADSVAQHLKDKDHSKQKAKANSTPAIPPRHKLQTAKSQAPQLQVHKQDPQPVKPTPATSASNTGQLPPIKGSSQVHQKSTILDSLEQDLLFKYLLARCHPTPRLKAQGYTIPNKDITTNNAKCLYSGMPHTAHAYPSPPHTPSKTRKALVLATKITKTNDIDTIEFMTVIDFLTAEILYDSIPPQEPIQNENLDVTEDGTRRARNVLDQYVDENTILIGHGLNKDLNTLNMFTTRIVDVAIVTSEAVFGPLFTNRSLGKIWELGVLTEEMLGWGEMGIDGGSESCLWDALAVREVLLWCLKGPECLRIWAERARADCFEQVKGWEDLEGDSEGEFEDFDCVGRDDLVD